MQKKLLIVGVDPGTTIGITLMDIKGRIIRTMSRRDYGVPETISTIAGTGIPLCIGTDKAKIPRATRMIASSMGIRIYSPAEDMTSEDKREIIANHQARTGEDILYSNAHEYDSICCAILAYTKSQKLLRKIDAKSSLVDKKMIHQFYKRGISEEIPLHRLIEILSVQEEAKEDKKQPIQQPPSRIQVKIRADNDEYDYDAIIRGLEEKIKDNERTIKRFQNKTDILRKRIKSIESKDMKKLKDENSNAKAINAYRHAEEKLSRIIELLRGGKEIIRVGDTLYMRHDAAMQDTVKRDVISIRGLGIEAYDTEKKEHAKKSHLKHTMNVVDILEEHRMLRRIEKENEKKKIA
jgi:uncharacterized protein